MTRIETYVRLFENASIAAAILQENTLRVDLANDAMLKLWGRDTDVIGLNLLDFMPELKSQGFPQLIDKVFKTHQYYHCSGSELKVNKEGKSETLLIDYSYTYIPAEANNCSAILILAKDSSEGENLKNIALKEEDERKLRSIVMSASIPMCVFRGDHLEAEIVNESMLTLWQQHKKVQANAIEQVLHQGTIFTEKVDQILYSYTPLRDALGRTQGIVVIGNKMDV